MNAYFWPVPGDAEERPAKGKDTTPAPTADVNRGIAEGKVTTPAPTADDKGDLFSTWDW